jgi:glycosyltransferase involved in cell wall biosynthesis
VARLAWFSPVPPARSGVAACTADLLPRLRASHAIDVFVDEPLARRTPAARSAHEFPWRHHRDPYDLAVYQLGNSSVHDYLWPYLFRFPGLVVLHDAHLHHARAAALLRQRRPAAYRDELAANHPDRPRDLAEIAVAGFDSRLFYAMPMVRLVLERARLTAVHAPAIARQFAAEVPGAAIDVIRLGHGRPLAEGDLARVRQEARARYGLPSDAVVFGCYGSLAPEKRIREVLEAFQATVPYAPETRLVLGGAVVPHYDVEAEVRARGLASRTLLTGYLEDEEALTACIAACDVSLNLRWPTAREISGPWLRSLALGRATVITDLAHLVDVPTVDPRTWQPNGAARPVAVAVDITDEAHSLRLALRRLATDAELRASLGAAAQSYWNAQHSLDGMTDDYHRVIGRALERDAPAPPLPEHLTADGTATLDRLLAGVGVPSPLR